MVAVLTQSLRSRGQVPLAGEPVPAQKARELILNGRAPAGLRVTGHVDLSDSPELVELPAGLSANSLDLSGCTSLRALPPDLQVRRLNLSGCRTLRELPSDLRCYQLEMRFMSLRSLPSDLCVEYRLDLEGCTELEALPPHLKVGSLILRDCSALKALPEGLHVYFLDISGCSSLAGWPEEASIGIGRLNASGCERLRSLPPWLTHVAQLDVNGCTDMTEFPEGLAVRSWIDVADTGIRALPSSLQGVRLRWRGVPIDERIAFHPETITAQEVLGETNAELRRVLLERMGYERFLQEADAEVLGRDRDAGGERRLLKVPLQGDEDLVCLSVICPSTGRQYLLRVPPRMRNCRRAAAWIAGFDNPDDYRPIAET